MAHHLALDNRIRQHLFVRGVVQGVGFRPFVYGLALEHSLVGFVGNNSEGVFIEVEGTPTAIAVFIDALRNNPPPLAHIESITSTQQPTQNDAQFLIVPSEAQPGANTLISPDLCVCDDCLREMAEPANRRYRYPFINCTNCGPRFTIIKDVPYDRPFTTMADFPMCVACAAEYHDPLNRRFHAQPNACPQCGPHVTFWRGDAQTAPADAIQQTCCALDKGDIIAIKGLGGFHLACDAHNHEAVMRLRQRKGRADKPFAVMVRDVTMAREIAHINEAEAALLQSRERPIVLLDKKNNALSAAVAPNLRCIGVMLAYTPLHYLLVQKPLVMTSANYHSEPIVKDNAEALEKLATIADAFLLHDRAIHVHCDNSVMRVVDDAPHPLRRSRGYAPFPVKLPFDVAQMLAVGGELKSTFCLTKGDYAFMSQHIGDMANLETLHAFERAYQHMSAIFRVQPTAIVCDQHPRYLSSQWAARFAADQNIPLIKVQHHHAHIASVMAEHNLTEPVIGFSYDGTGYGDDGCIWGGEVFIADYGHCQRVSHLPYMPFAGGDAAVKKPYRLALAYLWHSGIAWNAQFAPVQQASTAEKRILQQQLERDFNVVQTSSMGRLFDAVAALIGVRQIVTYEAQAAIEMENIAAETQDTYPFDTMQMLLLAIVDDLHRGIAPATIAGKFHSTIAHHILHTSQTIRDQHGVQRVVLSGGVFQNVRLLRQASHLLKSDQFDVFIHHRVPANDGELALGQIMVASQQL